MIKLLSYLVYIGVLASSVAGALHSYIISDRLALIIYGVAIVLWSVLLIMKVRNEP